MQKLRKIEKKIRSAEVQGAKEIAIYALTFLKEYCKTHGFGKQFEAVAERLKTIRPTAVVLHNCIEILKKRKKLSTIEELIEKMNRATELIARRGQMLIEENSTLMTHCHSGEALATIKEAWKRGKKVKVIATITEPLEQGKKTARELAQNGIPVTLITDSAVGYFIGDVDLVVVGADALRVVKPLGVVNKIGTKLLALAAWEARKPFYVVANTLKIDRRRELRIEERPGKEICKPIRGVKIKNPAFDLTPYRYVKRVVSEIGTYTPREILRRVR